MRQHRTTERHLATHRCCTFYLCYQITCIRIAGVDAILLLLEGDADLDEAWIAGVASVTPDRATPSGLRVGMTEADVFERLDAARLAPIPNEYGEGNHWQFVPADPTEDHLTVVFRMWEGEIVQITGGFRDAAHRPEGCA